VYYEICDVDSFIEHQTLSQCERSEQDKETIKTGISKVRGFILPQERDVLFAFLEGNFMDINVDMSSAKLRKKYLYNAMVMK
jgi:hypothetical protein